MNYELNYELNGLFFQIVLHHLHHPMLAIKNLDKKEDYRIEGPSQYYLFFFGQKYKMSILSREARDSLLD